MRLSSKNLAIAIIVLLFGSIALANGLGWWKTETTKEPAKFTEGEAAGTYNPADIRGSYTLGDVSDLFGVPLADLSEAFQLPAGTDAAAFQLKSLETIYAESPQEIGTASVRMFVAFYKGLPFDLSEETWLLQPAAEILKRVGAFSDDQRLYLENHTLVMNGEALTLPEQPAVAETPALPEITSTPAAAEHTESDRTVKGTTTFSELLAWGVPQAAIESIIGGPMPAPDVVVKDFCAEKGLTFSSIKPELQAAIP